MVKLVPEKKISLKELRSTKRKNKRKKRSIYPWTQRGDVYSIQPSMLVHTGEKSSNYESYWSKKLDFYLACKDLSTLKPPAIGFYRKKGIKRVEQVKTSKKYIDFGSDVLNNMYGLFWTAENLMESDLRSDLLKLDYYKQEKSDSEWSN